jgi:hypothetical protein
MPSPWVSVALNRRDLSRTVDKKTQELLEKQRQLSVGEDALDDKQRAALEDVNTELEGLGFRYIVRDPQYTEYLRQRYQSTREKGSTDAPTTPDSQRVSDRVQTLIKSAVARAASRTGGGDA